ncbi:MAG: protein kinase, partial [Actinomycetota bacterium]|nr:protein kinase [Actinomycetota bacterium]
MPVGLEQHAGRVLGARYRLLAPLGAGASAVVYVAEDLTLRRRVAVKVLHPGLAGDERFRRRFRAEAHASAQLSHPHILAVFDWADAETRGDGQVEPAYLVSELLGGGSLRSLLDQNRTLSLSQTLLVGLQAAQGLAHAHERGFVHRDIKPANLLFDGGGRLRIADFGIARALAEAAWTEPENSLIGTARYAAPEQAAGGPIDGRSDVYALAVTLVEAATGEVPLIAPTALATMVARQDTDLPIPDALGPLAEALQRAGRAEVRTRLAAAELVDLLLELAPSLPRPAALPVMMLRPAEPSTVPRTVADQATFVLTDPDATVDLRPAVTEAVATGDLGDDPDQTSQLASAEPISTGPIETTPVVIGSKRTRGRSRRLRLFALVGLLAAAAGVAYAASRLTERTPEVAAPITHPVGGYAGRPAKEVEVEIKANGWGIATTRTREDGFEKGTVVRQSPAPGVALKEGAEVTLVISDGFLLRIVPQLEGLAREEALAALSAESLLMGDTSEEFSETVPVNVIIRASLPVGREVESQTVVDLVWSLGPEPRVIPEFINQPAVDAVAALEGAGLVVAPIEEYSLTVPEGVVISVNPGAGQEV